MPFDVEDIQFLKKLDDGLLYFYCDLLRQGYTYSSSQGFIPFDFPQEIVTLEDLILQEDGSLLMSGFAETPAPDWQIVKADNRGNILTRIDPELIYELKDGVTPLHVKLDGENFYEKGKNLEAYASFQTDLALQEQPIHEIIHINQSSWDKKRQLLWLINREQIRAVRPDGKVVYQKKVKLDDELTPILFDGKTTWISNRRDGLIAVDLKPNYFTNYRFFDQDLNNSTRGIFLDEKGVIWASTINGTAKIMPDGKVLSKEILANLFTRYMEDSKGSLWFFTESGLIRHNIKTSKESLFPIGVGFEGWSLIENGENEIWFSGFDGRILKLDIPTKEIRLNTKFPNYPNPKAHVYEYLQKDSSTFWVCTSIGLFEISSKAKILNIYNNEQKSAHYIPTNIVHHMHIDPDSNIWLATGDAGLIKLNQKNGKLFFSKQFTTENGLSSNALHAIYEDDYDYLWISSDDGLMQFDKRTEKVYTYFAEDGIPQNEFNRIAHHKAHDGRLLLGGLLGITVFHPKDFSESRNQKSDIPLVISNYQQFSAKENKFIDLTHQLQQDKTITLYPNDHFFNLKLAFLDYTNAQRNFKYRINENKDWESNASGEFRISGLAYGHHTMEVKAFDGHRKEAKNNLKFDIYVLKPFYLKWWFAVIILGVLLICGWWLVLKKKMMSMKNSSAVNPNKVEGPHKITREHLRKVKTSQDLSTDQKEAIRINEEQIAQNDIEWINQVGIIAKREIKNRNFNIEHLANEMHISKRQFYRRIKKITGLTPNNYLKTIRLQRAKDILEKERPLTLTEVCYAIGFENTTHFANLFESEFGIRPHDLLDKS